MSIRRKLASAATAAGIAAVSSLTIVSPVAADAPGGATAWDGTGTVTAGPATTARVVANGLSDSAVFAYDNFAPASGGSGASGSWDFTTTSDGTGPVEVDYLYTGFHAFFQVTVGLKAVIVRDGAEIVSDVVTAGPTSCCTSPSAGFSYAGTHTFDLEAGDVYGFRLTGSNGDLNSRLRGRLIVGAPGTVHADTVVLNGYDFGRVGTAWGLTESYLATMRSYLRDPDAFGPAGKSPTDYIVADGIDVASPETLLGTDAFFTGWVPSASYTSAEKAALVDFVRTGGSLIATTDDTTHTMVDAFGLTQADGTANPSTFVDAGHPVAAGPFGTDTTYDEYASVGHYSALGPDAVAVALNTLGQVTMAEISPDVLAPGSGLALFLADIDFFTDAYTGAADNEILIGNLFDYLADTRRPAPTESGTAQLVQAVPSIDGSEVAVVAVVTGPPGSSQDVALVTSNTCTDGVLGAGTVLGAAPLAVGATGEQVVVETYPIGGTLGTYAALRVGDVATGTTSACVVAGPENDSWIRAQQIPLAADTAGEVATGNASGFLDSLGNSRWYRFSIQPGSRVTVDLTSLPGDYDLALYTDIAQAFVDVSTVDDLDQLGAEFAPSVFSPSVFSPSVFSPSVFSPDAYAPSVFSPSVFSPSVFSPSVFSPSVFSPSVFSPSVFSPSVFSPSVFSPSVFSPSVFSPSVFSPSVFSPENFASAQVRSLIAVSALPGTGDEVVVADTWSNTGEFYARVTGKNGEFDLEDPFELDVTVDGVDCLAVDPIAPDPSDPGPAPDAGSYTTLILHDPARLAVAPGNDAASLAELEVDLAAYAARPEVAGKIVDLGDYPHIAALHAQADANTQCPYAENLLASAIKDIVDGYRALNDGTLEYITIVGSDAQVPFFRYPDQALLGPEQDYEPPVAELSQSQSALRRNHILGQDEYGARRVLSLAGGRFPLPQLAVGRIVETASEMSTVLAAYLSTTDGVVDTPTSSLVTGYDFLADNADAVQAELVAGLNEAGTSPARNDALITAGDISPEDPRSWTADQLRDELLGDGEDVVFLAGHFSANSALAADYETVALATELAASDVDLWNSIVFSGGCHSGYNIVDGDAVPFLTEPLDWTQAFAQKGATLIAGTGYQYGDTDFIEYSERLYLLFARELRRGEGAVSVGQALARAKQQYLATTPEIRGLHRKSVLISTVFGLPNLKVDMPGERLPLEPIGPGVSPTPATTDPGLQLGLQTADLQLSLAGQYQEREVELDNLADPATPIMASYLAGVDGVVTNPAEPAIPLVRRNVTVDGQSLRGVGFRGGAWSDEDGVVPLTGAPTTELRGVHTPFASTVNFPMRLAIPNYFGGLTGTGGTGLSITPVQHRVEQIGDTEAIRRTFGDLGLRLYYSSNTTTYGTNTPALSAPPTFAGAQARRDGDDVLVRARVVGDPAVGIQEVWVTYTDGGQSSGTWVSLDLTQDPDDSTVWSGRIVDGATFARLDVMFQAVNGVGLVTMDDNYGAYYSIQGEVGEVPTPPADTSLSISGPVAATYGETITATATLAAAGAIADQAVLFTLGGSARVGTTDANGVATVELPVTAVPGDYSLVASFAGTAELAPSSAATTIRVEQADTAINLVLETDGTRIGAAIALTDEFATALPHRTVVVGLTGPDGTHQVARITDLRGRVFFGPAEFDGVQIVDAGFAGDSVYAGSLATRTAIVGDALAVPAGPVPIGSPVELDVLAPAERGFGTAAATVDWGEGAGPVELEAPTASHLYATPGVYLVTVELTDVDGRTSSVTSDFVVVYDPSAGFVTGGGWVWSAPGAVIDQPDVEGKATFGFISKYQKGATVPTGNTNFQFRSADLHFESTAYEWLVVSGSKGQFRGQGTINGTGSYDFALTAVDGDPSTFRLQIWNRDGGGLVYDTQRGDGATGEGVPLGGGSIKIHTPKGKG